MNRVADRIKFQLPNVIVDDASEAEGVSTGWRRGIPWANVRFPPVLSLSLQQLANNSAGDCHGCLACFVNYDPLAG